MRNYEQKHISFLLGAGFSVPAGYPTASELNRLISNCQFGNVGFSPSGELCISIDGSMPDFGYRTVYDDYYDFLKDVISSYQKNYCLRQLFDYEKFYDYIRTELKGDGCMKQIYDSYEHQSESFEQYCSNCLTLYNQLLSHLLKDKTGNKDYSQEPFIVKPQPDFHYKGFLECVECFSKKTIVDIHTLNHDLFIDRLNRTEWINGNMCDGFEELGSPFYGEIEVSKRKYKCRLEYFTNEYNKPIRLYKLHGSVDYYIYYEKDKGNLIANNIVKTKYGVNTANLLKEIKRNSKLEYDNCWINYHPFFLSGTTSKIAQYRNPLIYQKLFEHFKENLSKSKILIVIGYSGADYEINNIIENSNVPKIIVVDKSDKILKHPLVLKGAIPLNKGIESLSMNDIIFNPNLN